MANDAETTTKRKGEAPESRPKKAPRTKGDFIKDVNRISSDDFMSLHVPESSLHFKPRQKTDDGTNHPHKLAFSISLKVVPDSSKETALAHTIKDVELEECFGLIKLTSEDAYRPSSFGWSPRRKKREMRDQDMRYLLVRRNSNTPTASPCRDETEHEDAALASQSSSIEPAQPDGRVQRPIEGFASFMLTYEDGYPVIYIYEIHLDPALRSIGLGAHLLEMMESIGKSTGVEKAMLTVFRSNESARTWYRKFGYGLDDYSPKDVQLRGGVVRQADYLILSKSLREVDGR